MKKFIISRTSNYSDDAPCKEAVKESLTKYIYGTWSSLEEAKKSNGMGWFFSEGTKNHTEIDGMVRCERLIDTWTIEVEDIEDLLKYGDLVLKSSGYREVPIEIEIYDDYRE